MDLRICSRTNCRSLSRSFPARHLAPPATRMGSKNSTPMRLVSLCSTTSKRWSKHQTIAASALYLARGDSKWNTLRIRHLVSGHYIGGRRANAHENRPSLPCRLTSIWCKPAAGTQNLTAEYFLPAVYFLLVLRRNHEPCPPPHQICDWLSSSQPGSFRFGRRFQHHL